MIIFINGNMNSGKSTISDLLREKIDNPAVVEIDELRAFIKQVPIEQAVPINWQNAIACTKNLSGHNFNVIIPYPLSENNYQYVTEELANLNIPIYFITLNPSLNVLSKNRGTRELSQREVDRIKVLHEQGIADNSYGLVIDNSNQTPEETVAEILEYIKGSK